MENIDTEKKELEGVDSDDLDIEFDELDDEEELDEEDLFGDE